MWEQQDPQARREQWEQLALRDRQALLEQQDQPATWERPDPPGLQVQLLVTRTLQQRQASRSPLLVALSMCSLPRMGGLSTGWRSTSAAPLPVERTAATTTSSR